MRVFTRIACAILATALAVVAAVAIVEVVLALAARGPWIVDGRPWLEGLVADPWSSPTHRLVLLVALAIGIILLLVAWAPRRPVTIPVAQDRVPDDVEVSLRRREVERRVASAAREVPYVVEASARADQRVTLVAGSTRATDQSVQHEVEEHVRRAVHRLGLDPATTKIDVRTSAGRAA